MRNGSVRVCTNGGARHDTRMFENLCVMKVAYQAGMEEWTGQYVVLSAIWHGLHTEEGNQDFKTIRGNVKECVYELRWKTYLGEAKHSDGDV